MDELADRLAVSGMTVRRDLQELASAGKVIRTHGGAAPAARVSFEFRFLARASQLRPEKEAIAAAAAARVQDGQTVFLDSSTTTLAVARRLKDHDRLTVITTSLPIASELYAWPGMRLMLLGGFLQSDSADLTGAITESNLETLRGDVTFIGADGMDDQGFVYNASPSVGRMLARMAAASREAYVVADHTKLTQRALYRFGNVRHWNGLITDADTPGALVRKLRQAGVHVIQAQKKEE